MDTPGQQVLERTSVLVTPEFVEARFTVALPAAGRNILGHKAMEILVEALPSVVQNSLLYSAHKVTHTHTHTHTHTYTLSLSLSLSLSLTHTHTQTGRGRDQVVQHS